MDRRVQCAFQSTRAKKRGRFHQTVTHCIPALTAYHPRPQSTSLPYTCTAPGLTGKVLLPAQRQRPVLHGRGHALGSGDSAAAAPPGFGADRQQLRGTAEGGGGGGSAAVLRSIGVRQESRGPSRHGCSGGPAQELMEESLYEGSDGMANQQESHFRSSGRLVNAICDHRENHPAPSYPSRAPWMGRHFPLPFSYPSPPLPSPPVPAPVLEGALAAAV